MMKKQRLSSFISLILICLLLQACGGGTDRTGWSVEGLAVDIEEGIRLGSNFGTLQAGAFKRYLEVVGTFRSGSEPSLTSDEVYLTLRPDGREQSKIDITAIGLGSEQDYYVIGPFTGNLIDTTQFGVPMVGSGKASSPEGSFSLRRVVDGDGTGLYEIKLERNPSRLRLAFEVSYEFAGSVTLHLGGGEFELTPLISK